MSRGGAIWAAIAAVSITACAPKVPPGEIAAVTALAPPRLIAAPDPAATNVYLSASVLAGSALDPVGKEGLAELLARVMVDGGAGARDGEAVRDTLYRAGTAFEVVPGKDQITIRLRCHRDKAEVCLELFRDVIVAPALPEATVVRLRDEAIHAAKEGAADDEEALAWEVLDAWLFEGRPYGHPTGGRWGALPTISVEDLRRFHQEHYVAQRMVLGAAGAIDDASVARWLDGFFARTGEVRAGPPPLLRPPGSEGRSLLVVETGSPVVGFRLGHVVDVDRSHPDYPALYLAMTAFGSHRQSFGRLFRSLRGERGLNYGDYAYIEPYRERSLGSEAEQGVARRQAMFHMWIRPTSVDNAPFALKLALTELEDLVRDGLTQQELDDVRAWLIGASALWFADPGSRLAAAAEAEAGGWEDMYRSLPSKLEALTLDEVNAALRRHLRPQDLRIVAVGAADAWVERLVGAAPTPIVYQGVTPGAEQAARDAEVSARSVGIAADAVRRVPAEQVFR